MSLPAESSPRSRTWPASLNATSVTTTALPSPSSGPTVTPHAVLVLIPFHMLQATSVIARVPLLARLGNVGVEVAPMVREDAGRRVVEYDQRLHRRRLLQRVERILHQGRQHWLGFLRLIVFADHRLRHVVHHVRITLRVIEIVVIVPRINRTAVRLARAVEHRMGIAEHI